ncbi:MAG: transglutaminase domain-containing protein, partial [Clostridiales bacterium]|nr:transglutaminase domain-containing protein [Clostridiales bacterium]
MYLMVLPMMILLFYEIIKSFFYLLNITIIFPVLDGLERSIQGKSNFVKRFLSATFQIPKSICYVIVLTVIFNILVFANINSTLNDYLSSSKIYNYICRDV